MKKIINKIIGIILILSAAVLIGGYGINSYILDSTAQKIVSPDSLSGYDCIIVLGCGVKSDKTPSDMLRDRLLCAIDLYKSGAADKIIMSGDHGSAYYDEVNVMRSFAMERGVESDDIFMDHAGFSSYETIYRARDVFMVKKAVVVTQLYHLPRVLHICNSLAVEAVGVPADKMKYSGMRYYEAREALARIKDFFTCLIKPLPTYLGEPIPVFGNGNTTKG